MDETVYCPKCRAELTLPAAALRRTVECPRCKHPFQPFGEDAPAAPSSLGPAWKTTLALALVTASILTFALQLFVNGTRMGLLAERDQVFVGNFIPDFDDRWTYWEQTADKMLGFTLLVLAASAIGFFIWLYQVSDNLRVLQADGLTHAPGGAVAAFFVPFVFLFRPCAILQEIGRASDPRAVRHTTAWKGTASLRCITWWWLCFLAAIGIAVLCLWIDRRPHDGDTEEIALLFWCGSNIAMIAAGVFLLVTIRALEDRQHQRFARLYSGSE
jgi:hypothetical protein